MRASTTAVGRPWRGFGVGLGVGAWVLLSLGLPLLLLIEEGLRVAGPPAPPWVFVLAGLRALGLAAAVAMVAVVAAYPVARTLRPGLVLVLVLVAALARALGVLGLGLEPGATVINPRMRWATASSEFAIFASCSVGPVRVWLAVTFHWSTRRNGWRT